ncbi:hypothetical protein EDD21DRAFT_355593 [Dissophora ornata]|nr:hypothetical protein BGZ58_010140 [Dissophora ornata]KAI8599298.1 hypothetical protein EDD21DRAFT_355593 [Dissophora ornata]
MTTATFINTTSVGSNSTHANTANHEDKDVDDGLPSPTSPLMTTPLLDLLLLRDTHPIPDGKLSDSDRADLSHELDQLKVLSAEAQQTYLTVHASIQQYQQLVLSTHAQVAAAKQALVQASNTLSRTSSPPSTPRPSSPLGRSDSYTNPDTPRASCDSDNATHSASQEDEARLRKLGEQHVDLGNRLSHLLRDKAAEEETKKRLNDGLVKAKARIKEIEQKLDE